MFKQFFYKRRIKKILHTNQEPTSLARTLAGELVTLDRVAGLWPIITIRHPIDISTRYASVSEFVRDLELIRDTVANKAYLTKLSLPARPAKTQSLYEWCQTPEGYNIDLASAIGYTRDLVTEIVNHLREYDLAETPHNREYANYIRRKCEYFFNTANRLLKIGVAIEKEQLWLLNQ
jgi:glyoxylate carboligase